ncbi:MFS transporter [Sphingopyxis sp. USTB-05]|uniref:MFS transporter n=1 Tax=Sphingopyxis sp. USTB-05 TaxID=2830667 RepID=UPI00207855ED|nr:MFS transporter [Sphingopyxis sp. USTB-05]USI77598.1 MFS transporter [Sphingopyxis sp. USTB-05]
MSKKWPTRQHMSLATVSVAADITYFVLPLVLGALTERHGMSRVQGGMIATVQVMSTAVAVGLIFPIAHRISARWFLYCGLSMLILGNMLTILADGFASLVALRALAGGGEGVVLAVIGILIGLQDEAERGFAVQAFGVGLGSAIVSLLAPLLVPSLGADAIFMVLGLLPLAAMFMVPGITRRATAPGRASSSPIAAMSSWAMLRSPIILLLVVSFFSMVIASNATYIFFEQTARSVGLTFVDLLYVMAVVNMSMLLGPLFAHWAGVRFGRLKPILVAYAGLAIGAMMIGYAASASVLISGLVLQAIAAMLVKPYMNGLCVAIDPTGRLVTLNYSVYRIGSGITPMLATVILAAGYGSHGLAIFSVALVGVATISVIIAVQRKLFGASQPVIPSSEFGVSAEPAGFERENTSA